MTSNIDVAQGVRVNDAITSCTDLGTCTTESSSVPVWYAIVAAAGAFAVVGAAILVYYKFGSGSSFKVIDCSLCSLFVLVS